MAIGYRTLPGTEHAAGGVVYARQRPQRERRNTASGRRLRPTTWTAWRVSSIPRGTLVPDRKLCAMMAIEVGIIAYGTSHHAVVESLDQLQDEYGVKTDYLRLRAYPFTSETHKFIAAHKRVYVVDQNRDGQMLQLLRLDIAVPDIISRCAASAITTGCRLTRAPSPTKSFRRRASKWQPQPRRSRLPLPRQRSTASASR